VAPTKVFLNENGPFILADTLEDAIKVLRKLGGNPAAELPLLGKTVMGEEEAIHKFWLEINKNARILLTHLLKYPEGTTGDKFSEEIKIAPEKFGGILGGTSKIAKKFGIKFEEVVTSQLRTEGTLRFRWLCPGPLLLKYKGAFKPVGIKLAAGKTISLGA
jgi:hypothetical protein